MKYYLFLDLDDTIFQTKRKCFQNELLHTAAYGRDGLPMSFMTSKQLNFFSTMDKEITIIPTTARNYESFKRVDLNFRHCIILDFGGIILMPNRDLDTTWFEKIREYSKNIRSALCDIQKDICLFIESQQLEAFSRIIEDFELPLYIVVKSRQGNINALDIVRQHIISIIDTNQFYIHFNDNNLAIIPHFLNKLNAVEYIINKYIETQQESFLTFGMGDSLTDIPFMKACDYMIMPKNSQIWRNIDDSKRI
ncbi:MAG: HAD hydrolase family protein [Desulfobacterales bacterium]|nr:HAD hydrolase family protein [Desulfobacterales bacterium]